MYTISLWASRHSWSARLLIICALVLLTVSGFFVGDALQQLYVSLPLFLFYAAVAVFLAVFLIYPDKRYRSRFTSFYRYQKTCDAVLLAATFCFLTCIGNRPEPLLHLATAPAAAMEPNAAMNTKDDAKNGNDIQPPQKTASKKRWKHAFAAQLKQWRKAYKEMSRGWKVVLIVLTFIVAFGLVQLVGALACSLACSGSEGAAILLAIVGYVGIIFLAVWVIRRILNGPRHKAKPASAP